ncbi:DUF4440 domain-containing protein [Sphingomicrobium nitratireducens]|uniref:DUF4440 domain-containing protein n=1 Tax=Sphingomicrobium nitratireducens TaxID=2964666 RepID=UPI00223EF1ED|nr:DUF4440 domain-containing protein [Sphingomicrobium nitratireducens]
MADISSKIETLEHQLMRGWIQGDTRVIRKLTRRDMMLIVGAQKSLLLDRPSWIEAARTRWTVSAYRFRDVFVRKHGYTAWFAAAADLEMKLDGGDWSGTFWITDCWRLSNLTYKWNLAERSVSRIDTDEDIPGAIRQLQLWR